MFTGNDVGFRGERREKLATGLFPRDFKAAKAFMEIFEEVNIGARGDGPGVIEDCFDENFFGSGLWGRICVVHEATLACGLNIFVTFF